MDPASPIELKPLGRTGIPVAPVIFGTMARNVGQPASEREDLVRRALDLGLTTLDTAPLYEFGESERIIGRAIKGRRDRVVLATKVGVRWDDDHGDLMFAFTRDGETVEVRRDSRPAAVRADVEGSLERLGVDCLDLVQIHQYDGRTPLKATIDALLELREAGKLKAIGVSNFDVRQTHRAELALGNVPLACVQLPYSLLDRALEKNIAPWIQRAQVPILAYSPLAEGLLVKDGPCTSPHQSWLHDPAHAGGIQWFLGEFVDPIGRRHGVSRAAVAMGWLCHRGAFPVFGASRPEHLDAAADAARLRLSAAEMLQLDRASARLAARIAPGGGQREWIRARLARTVQAAVELFRRKAGER